MSALCRYMGFSEKAGMDEMVTDFGGDVLFGVVAGVTIPALAAQRRQLTTAKKNISRPNHQKFSRPPEDPHLRKKGGKEETPSRDSPPSLRLVSFN